MEKIVVSYGGGTNSTAMLIGMVSREIKPDAILFADTGGERQHTYEYIKYFNKWLVGHGFPEIEIVRYKTKDGLELTLEQDVLKNMTLPAIAFGFKSCSEKFKIRPQDKWVDDHFSGEQIAHYIGFDFSEQRRVRDNPNTGHRNVYPLIEWRWDRAACVMEIIAAGLCLPGKSSCFFCPNMRKHEILALSDEEKERAMAMEANAKRKVELAGLGRNYSWTDLINADKAQLSLFDDIELYESPCNCID